MRFALVCLLVMILASAGVLGESRGRWVTTVTGRERGFTEGVLAKARFNEPAGLAIDAHGAIYVADAYNHRIRRIDPSGVVETFAGGGRVGVRGGSRRDRSGDQAKFRFPRGVAIAPNGMLYVADTNNQCIRRITPDGTVATLAGGAKGLADGQGTAARFEDPWDLTVARDGTVYVADTYNHRIRRITPEGQVTTIAGSGPSGLEGGGYRDGPAAQAMFRIPRGLAIAPDGSLLIADAGNQCVRQLDPRGEVSTIWGGPPLLARAGSQDVGTLIYPTGLALAQDGTLYVADAGADRIDVCRPHVPIATFVGFSLGHVDAPWLAARFNAPSSLAFAPSGALYVSDSGNHCLRLVE